MALSTLLPMEELGDALCWCLVPQGLPGLSPGHVQTGQGLHGVTLCQLFGKDQGR